MTNARCISWTIIAVVCLTALATTGTVQAQWTSGQVTGQLRFWNRLGNYCDPVYSCFGGCSGAFYVASQYNTSQPIPHTKVYVRAPDDSIIGMGQTDVAGNFTVSWNDPRGPASLYVTWHAEERHGRFTVRPQSGGTFFMWSNSLPRDLDGTTEFGTLTWGSSGSPHEVANIYVAAWREWWEGLWWSDRMYNTFTNVSIYVGTTHECVTSGCASGPNRWVKLAPSHYAMPQARVMHEMGHVASWLSHDSSGVGYLPMAEYCYPTTGSGCSWAADTAEWRQPAEEEGRANWFADIGLWSRSRQVVSNCLSNLACACNYRVDLSDGPITGPHCPDNEDRDPLTIERIFWDAFDTTVDCTGGFCDNTALSINNMTNIWASYPPGTCSGCVNEGWSCTSLGCSIVNRDARTMWDFAYRTTVLISDTNIYQTVSLNCH